MKRAARGRPAGRPAGRMYARPRPPAGTAGGPPNATAERLAEPGAAGRSPEPPGGGRAGRTGAERARRGRHGSTPGGSAAGRIAGRRGGARQGGGSPFGSEAGSDPEGAARNATASGAATGGGATRRATDGATGTPGSAKRRQRRRGGWGFSGRASAGARAKRARGAARKRTRDRRERQRTATRSGASGTDTATERATRASAARLLRARSASLGPPPVSRRSSGPATRDRGEPSGSRAARKRDASGTRVARDAHSRHEKNAEISRGKFAHRLALHRVGQAAGWRPPRPRPARRRRRAGPEAGRRSRRAASRRRRTGAAGRRGGPWPPGRAGVNRPGLKTRSEPPGGENAHEGHRDMPAGANGAPWPSCAAGFCDLGKTEPAPAVSRGRLGRGGLGWCVTPPRGPLGGQPSGGGGYPLPGPISGGATSRWSGHSPSGK